MNIYLDSLPITVVPDGIRIRYAPRAEIERRYDGELLSSVTTSRGWTRIWEVTTTEDPAATIASIQALLSGPGSVPFSGDLVASGPLSLYPRNITRRVGQNAQLASLTFELWEEAVVLAERKELIRVWVADANDTLQNLSEWFMGATITASVEAFAKTADVVFWRETADETMSPLMTSPAPIAEGRRIRLESAIIGVDETVQEADWERLFTGRVDDVAWGGNASRIRVPCRDGAGRLHDGWVLDETTEGDNVSPVAIETVMQGLIDANLTANPPTIHVVGDPDFGIYEYNQRRQSLQDALFALRDNIGWDLRYRWNASDLEDQLTFYEPDRTKTVPDHTFALTDYFEITGVELSALGVRNRVIIDWDADADAVVVEDTSSIAEYANDESDGIFVLYLDETRNPQINSLAAALALGGAVLAETAFPALSHTARNAFAPEVEIGDLCRYAANNVHYNTDQDVAIVGFTHEISASGNSTTIQARGAPSGSVTRWYKKHKERERIAEIEDATEDPPTLSDRVLFFYTEKIGGPGYSRFGTSAGSLGGWVSRTEVAVGLYGLFREITEAESTSGITLYRSIAVANTDPSPSAEDFECVIGFLSPDEGASGSYVFSVGLGPAGSVLITDAAQQGAISADEETAPDASPAIVYTSPLEAESGVIDVGTIAPGYARIIHLRLEVLPGATGQYTGEALILQDQVPAEV